MIVLTKIIIALVLMLLVYIGIYLSKISILKEYRIQNSESQMKIAIIDNLLSNMENT